MDILAFTFNTNAKYAAIAGPRSDLTSSDLTKPVVQVTKSDSFQATFPDVFQKYVLPKASSNQLIQAWYSNPMQWWQNQLNFAVWCATTGCGVSGKDHLSAPDPQIRALYRFHVYYQIRRILAEIQAPLPQDDAWEASNNTYNRRAYERICSEMGVSPNTGWRRNGVNKGFGKAYSYWTTQGYHPTGRGPNAGYYDGSHMSFQRGPGKYHVDFIQQDPNTDWNTFILDKPQGFTHPGVERLNDSIRTYVWAILGAQAQTRTRVIGEGTAFDAQKQFLADIEDAISSPVDLPSAIKRYQDVLRYAGSQVDFVFGIGLYMAPSDMLLRIGQVEGYNNEIVIAKSHLTLGENAGVNVSDAPPNAANHTGETGLVASSVPTVAERSHGVETSSDSTTSSTTSSAKTHESDKTALVVGGVAIGLLLLWFRS